MNWKNSFEAMGEAVAMRAEGERAMAEEISRLVKRLILKVSARMKRQPAAAE